MPIQKEWPAAIAIVAVLVGAGIAVARFTSTRGQKPPIAAPVPIAAKDFIFTGKLRAQHTVPVGAMVIGTIDAFLVDVGQEVSEGQLLARITNEGLEIARAIAAKEVDAAQAKINSTEAAINTARLEASRARADATRAKDAYDHAERIAKRQQFLDSQGATPHMAYEKAQREFEMAEKDFRSLDEVAGQAEARIATLTQELQGAKRAIEEKNQELEDAQGGLAATEVHAPVNGVVIARRGEVGKQIGQEEAKELFQIAVDLSLLEAAFDAPPEVVHRIQPGAQAFVSLPEFQSAAFPANVKEVKGSEVVAEFTSPNANIRPGMTCSVTLPGSQLK
jgi:multidrug resistance efflux pump